MPSRERFSKTKKPKSKEIKFTGNGYRLGGFFAPTVIVKPEKVEVIIKLWNDGFSIDEGPLRAFEDPRNEAFMEALKRGNIPEELEIQHKGSKIDAQLMQMKRTFPKPRHRVTFIEEKDDKRTKMAPFSGKGRTLRDPTTVTEETVVQKKRVVDSTSIAVRLPDGSRKIAFFKRGDRVSDLKRYVSSDPMMKGNEFRLLVSFPPRSIENEEASLAAEGLFKTLVLVRLFDARSDARKIP